MSETGELPQNKESQDTTSGVCEASGAIALPPQPSLESEPSVVKKPKKKARTNKELRDEVFKQEKENRSLKRRVKSQEEMIIKLSGGGYIPGYKITEWREKCFLICQGIDELRDAMREVSLDVGAHPKYLRR